MSTSQEVRHRCFEAAKPYVPPRRRKGIVRAVCLRKYGLTPLELAKAARKRRDAKEGETAGDDGMLLDEAVQQDADAQEDSPSSAVEVIELEDVLQAEEEASAADATLAKLKERLLMFKDQKKALVSLLKQALDEEKQRRKAAAAAPPPPAASPAPPPPGTASRQPPSSSFSPDAALSALGEGDRGAPGLRGFLPPGFRLPSSGGAPAAGPGGGHMGGGGPPWGEGRSSGPAAWDHGSTPGSGAGAPPPWRVGGGGFLNPAQSAFAFSGNPYEALGLAGVVGAGGALLQGGGEGHSMAMDALRQRGGPIPASTAAGSRLLGGGGAGAAGPLRGLGPGEYDDGGGPPRGGYDRGDPGQWRASQPQNPQHPFGAAAGNPGARGMEPDLGGGGGGMAPPRQAFHMRPQSGPVDGGHGPLERRGSLPQVPAHHGAYGSENWEHAGPQGHQGYDSGGPSNYPGSGAASQQRRTSMFEGPSASSSLLPHNGPSGGPGQRSSDFYSAGSDAARAPGRGGMGMRGPDQAAGGRGGQGRGTGLPTRDDAEGPWTPHFGAGRAPAAGGNERPFMDGRSGGPAAGPSPGYQRPPPPGSQGPGRMEPPHPAGRGGPPPNSAPFGGPTGTGAGYRGPGGEWGPPGRAGEPGGGPMHRGVGTPGGDMGRRPQEGPPPPSPHGYAPPGQGPYMRRGRGQ